MASVVFLSRSSQAALSDISAVPTTTTQATLASSVVITNASGYKDGTYTASTNYPVRGSIENISVTLTVKDGVVSTASISQSGSDPESRRYQSRFASAYKQYVIGKSITSLNLSRISGASLTTSGFNSALAQIKSEAKA